MIFNAWCDHSEERRTEIAIRRPIVSEFCQQLGNQRGSQRRASQRWRRYEQG